MHVMHAFRTPRCITAPLEAVQLLLLVAIALTVATRLMWNTRHKEERKYGRGGGQQKGNEGRVNFGIHVAVQSTARIVAELCENWPSIIFICIGFPDQFGSK